MLSLITRDYLSFRRMVIPLVVEVVFWIGVASAVILALVSMYHGSWVSGIVLLILGPLLMRMMCELLIVLFRINDTLTDIKETLILRDAQEKFQVVVKSSDVERAEAAVEAQKHPSAELPLGGSQDLDKK